MERGPPVIPAVLVVLALAAAAFVLGPLRRPEAAMAEDPEGERLLRRRDAAYRAIRDLEVDRATGKIGEADYAPLRRRFEADAVETLHRLDALAGRAPAGPGGGGQPGGDGSA